MWRSFGPTALTLVPGALLAAGLIAGSAFGMLALPAIVAVTALALVPMRRSTWLDSHVAADRRWAASYRVATLLAGGATATFAAVGRFAFV